MSLRCRQAHHGHQHTSSARATIVGMRPATAATQVLANMPELLQTWTLPDRPPARKQGNSASHSQSKHDGQPTYGTHGAHLIDCTVNLCSSVETPVLRDEPRAAGNMGSLHAGRSYWNAAQISRNALRASKHMAHRPTLVLDVIIMQEIPAHFVCHLPTCTTVLANSLDTFARPASRHLERGAWHMGRMSAGTRRFFFNTE